MSGQDMHPEFKQFNPEADAGSVPSPCISVCAMNAKTGLCEGCFRTIDEIAIWSTASDETKRAVWKEIRRRQEALFPDSAR